jgi:hypothetical protein
MAILAQKIKTVFWIKLMERNVQQMNAMLEFISTQSK